MRETRLAAWTTVALHAGVLAALLAYEPARTALRSAAPIMVDWITLTPPRPEPQPPVTEPPRPNPVAKPRPRPAEPPPRVESAPVLTTPVETPSPIVAPPPPSAPPPPVVAAPGPAPVAPPPPLPVSAPIFNANYLENPAPPYPGLSRRLREEGRVILRVLVGPAGRAQEVQVRTSSGHARLDDSARETVGGWKFVPARRGEEPVAAWVLIPISFKVEN